MARRFRLPLLVLALAVLGGGVGGCGSQGISASVTSQYRPGAQLFRERCGGCHTLGVAGTEGTSGNIRDRERVDGPNLNKRHETVQSTLYAIRNGGFSGAIMPQNLVTGPEARQVAAFVARYAGSQASKTPANG
jgi:mono/diheme cytochrome c family protein